MRHKENARAVIERVKERLKEAEPSLPKGVRIVPTYDRSSLIERSIENLKHELTPTRSSSCGSPADGRGTSRPYDWRLS